MDDTFFHGCSPRWRQLAARGGEAWSVTNTPCETWRDVPVQIRVQLLPVPGQTTERPPLIVRSTLGRQVSMEEPGPIFVMPWGAGIRTIDDRNIEHVTITPIFPEEKKEASDGH